MPELSFRALLRVSLAALLLAASAAAQSARPGGAARTTTTSARSNNARGGSGRSNTTNSASRGSNGQHPYRSNTELGDAIITIDPETRSLVIVTDEDTHRELTGVIKSLDQPKPQVLIKVVFLEVTYNQGLDVGIEGSYTARIKSPLAATTGSRTTTGNTTTTNNGTTTIGASPTGSTGTTSTTTSTTKTNNGRTTTTSSTTNSASPGSTFAGTNGSNGTNTVATTLTETLGTAAKIGETAALSSLFGSPLTGSFVKLVSDDWSATLHALASKGKLEVLSRPSIMARNNQEAVIVVGSEVPFITNSRITDQGQTINTIQYDNVGIILRVTPFITSGNKVEMIVAPEISSLTDQTVPISNNASAPVIAKRSAETVIVTPHGQTAVIGGLMETQKTETVQKIPILGDIPILGIPFRRTIKQDQKRELLIFLTPYIVNDAQDLAQATNDEVAKANLPQKAFTPEDFGKYLDDLPLPTDGEKPYRGPVATPIPAKKPASAPKAVKVKASAL
jgi:general secretion pathway protein D